MYWLHYWYLFVLFVWRWSVFRVEFSFQIDFILLEVNGLEIFFYVLLFYFYLKIVIFIFFPNSIFGFDFIGFFYERTFFLWVFSLFGRMCEVYRQEGAVNLGFLFSFVNVNLWRALNLGIFIYSPNIKESFRKTSNLSDIFSIPNDFACV